jgi:hypothetical protein
MGSFPSLAIALLVLCSSGCSSKREPAPVGTSDPQINEAAPHLEEWLQLWRAALPGFQPESLYAAEVSPLKRGPVQTLREFIPAEAGDAAAFEVLSVDSPDRRWKLVFDRYRSIEDEDGEVTVSGEPDSSPLLVDLRDSTVNQFAFCGTHCGFDWGVWIGPNRFVLAGWVELEAPETGYRGTIGVYSITDSTSFNYHTRTVSASTYSRYRSAWEVWVSSKYQAMRHRSPT